jgi:NADH pyrophosphatase NudC (nudix superfamily)
VSAGSGLSADGPEVGPSFGELGGLALSRSDADRTAIRRGDAGWLEAAWADQRTRVLVVHEGQALMRHPEPGAPDRADGSSGPDGSGAASGAELVFVPPARAPEGIRFLLGVGADGVVYFGVAGALPAPGEGGARPTSLRQAGPVLSDRDAGLMTHAVALANWHAVFVHCPRCGALTEPVSSGHSRRCVADGSEHFPRIDPAVIMLVTDPDDRCLLARNAQWPQRRVSILAGFVEPGESAEQAVVREVGEETGIFVTAVRYVGSQPWPMPHSLMLGFRATAAGGEEIRVDAEEIAEARWFSRAELAGSISSGEILLPPPVSIAHRIIVSWYGSELAGAW